MKPFLALRCTTFKYLIRPVPVVFLRIAFTLQLYFLIFDAGYPQEAQVVFCLWKDLFPQRLHKVCVLVWRRPANTIAQMLETILLFANGLLWYVFDRKTTLANSNKVAAINTVFVPTAWTVYNERNSCMIISLLYPLRFTGMCHSGKRKDRTKNVCRREDSRQQQPYALLSKRRTKTSCSFSTLSHIVLYNCKLLIY